MKCHAVPFWLDKYLQKHFSFSVYVKFSLLLMNNFKPKVCELSNLHFQFFFLLVVFSCYFQEKKLLTVIFWINGRICIIYFNDPEGNLFSSSLVT